MARGAGARRLPSVCVAVVGLIAGACGADAGDEPASEPPSVLERENLATLDVPAELAAGETAFDANCAQCHGRAALGTDQGPPLVHRVYEPSHHGDAAFRLAVQRGVRPHHWRFGPMPPVPGLSDADVDDIIAYVRWLQRKAGVY